MSTRVRYGVEYGHKGFAGESDQVVGVWICRAFDTEHALQKFFDSDDGEGWKAFRVARIEDEKGEVIPSHRRYWVDV
jgi:hypothetical protein